MHISNSIKDNCSKFTVIRVAKILVKSAPVIDEPIRKTLVGETSSLV